MSDDVFDDGNKQSPISNFFKFEKVGDKVSGILINVSDQDAKGVFGATKVYTLKQADGELVKFSIPRKKGITIEMLAKAEIGQMVGVKFEKEIEPEKKGFNPTKALGVYLGATPELKKEQPDFKNDDKEMPF